MQVLVNQVQLIMIVVLVQSSSIQKEQVQPLLVRHRNNFKENCLLIVFLNYKASNKQFSSKLNEPQM